MMNRLLQIRRAISAVLSESQIEYYCDALKMFKEATLITTVAQAPTLSRYIATFAESEESNLQKLLKGQVITEGKPSLILNRLRGLNDGRCDDSVMRTIFVEQLPVHMLKKMLQNLSQQQASNPAIDLQNNLLLGLNIRFNFIDDCQVLIIAMMLDPRFKDRLLPEGKKESAHTLLQRTIMEYAGIQEADVATTSDMSETSGMLEKKLLLCS